jgi:hypothetical protein
VKKCTLTVLLLVVVLNLGLSGNTLAPHGALAQEATSPAPAGISGAIGTAFSYQGSLTDGTSPANGAYDFSFELYDAVGGGHKVANTLTANDVSVTQGTFTVLLDFVDGIDGVVFDGTALWLDISVRPGSSTGAYTKLTPRQALTAAPYAHSLQPGAVIAGELIGRSALYVRNLGTSGNSHGLVASSSSDGGTGVFGEATATSGIPYGVQGWSASPTGVGVRGRAIAASGFAYGVVGESLSASGIGVQGHASALTGSTMGVNGWSASNAGSGVYGVNDASTGTTYGVQGMSYSTNGRGVYGYAFANTGTTYGVYGQSRSSSGTGVYGQSTATTGATFGVYGSSQSPVGWGVFGASTAASGTTYGVQGLSMSPDGRGVYGHANATLGSTYGVYGQSDSQVGTGVYGQARWVGVYGTATGNNGTGVHGYVPSSTTNGYGVYGLSHANEGIGVLGFTTSANGYAGQFYGRVDVKGTLTKPAGSFKIDHPLDPEGKYLYHSFVESPDMKNIYDGVIALDKEGAASVQLPEWFEALNQDFRYQLTPIGAAMPNLHIAQTIQTNTFRIAGGEPGMEVSWQVTGIRHDPYAEANRIPVEERKPTDEQGTYLYPECYGQPESMGVSYELSQMLNNR